MNLAGGQGSSARGHDVFHPCLVHGHHVGVSLHQEAPLLLQDGRLRQVHAVEHPRLVVQDAFGGVEVLRDLLVGRQGPSSKSNDPACDVSDREHDAALEKVPQGTVVSLFAEARFDKLVVRVTRCRTRLGHGVPRIGAVTNQELVEHVVAKATLHEVAPANGLACVRCVELGREPLLGPSHQVAQAFLRRGRRQFFRCGRGLLNFNVVPAGQHSECLRVTDLLEFHQKRHQAPSFATRKALENALGRQDVKRGGLLVGEGAQPSERTARFFQFHVIANDVFNDGGVHDGIDGFLRNHGTEEKVEDTEVSWHKKRRSDAPLPETCCPTTRSLIGDFHLIELPLRELGTESRANLARA